MLRTKPIDYSAIDTPCEPLQALSGKLCTCADSPKPGPYISNIFCIRILFSDTVYQ
jgi:hypothetical protein